MARYRPPSAQLVCDITYAAALAVAVLVLALGGVLDRRLDVIGGDDLSKIWAGGRAVVLGLDPYDPLTWRGTATLLGTFPPDTDVYLYPPWVALSLVPLALLPLPLATVTWVAGGACMAAVSLWSLCRALLPPRPPMYAVAAATLLISGPAISELLTGQWSFLLIAATAGLVLALRSGRATGAAALSLAMLAKPQLFLFAAPAFALHALWPQPVRDRSRGIRYVSVACVAAAMVVGASWLLIPTWWPAWPTRVGDAQLVPESVSIPGLLFRTLGTPGLVLAAAVLVGAVLVSLRIHPRSPAWIPSWLALSIAATPYSNPYDLLVLVVPVVLASGALAARSPTRGSFLFYAAMALLLIAQTSLHYFALLAYAPLVPAAVFVLTAVALWPERRSVDPRGI